MVPESMANVIISMWFPQGYAHLTRNTGTAVKDYRLNGFIETLDSFFTDENVSHDIFGLSVYAL